MLKNWLNIFIYQIKNNKLFTALNILGLSMGIAGLVFAILYWNDEHSYDAWNPEKEKVFQVLNDVGEGLIFKSNLAPLESYLKTFPELESYSFFKNFYMTDIVTYKGKKDQITGIINSQNSLFSSFPFEFIKGNGANAVPDENSIAVSEKLAKQLFGNEDPMGKQLFFAERFLIVRAVYKIPGKSSLAPSAVVNFMQKDLENKKDAWGDFNYGLVLKLKDPSSAETIKKKIQAVYDTQRTAKWAKQEGMTVAEFVKKYGDCKVILDSLETSRLHSKNGGYPEGLGNYQLLLIMLGLSILILILSIVNYINLATANAIRRAKEVGVRKILGASKNNIVRQFLFETIITTFFALFLALVIVEIALPFYNDFLGKELSIDGSSIYLQLFFVFITVIVLAGILPAIYVSNFETLKVLKGNFGRSKNGIWLRNGMLIFQFSIASFFIIGSYIVSNQIAFMSSKDLGFKGEQILEINYRKNDKEDNTAKIFNKYNTLKQELLKFKGVENVATGTFSFGNSATSSTDFNYKGINVQGQNMAVDFEMLDMMQIKIAQGRNLSPQFSSDTVNSILINETALKAIHEKDPIGKEIDWNEQKLKVVGIVKDFHLYGPQSEIPPMVFFHFKTIDWMAYNFDKVYIKVNPENMETTIEDIGRFWTKNVDTKYAFQYDFVDKNFARSYQGFVKQKNLFTLLNFVVILIALFGLFALASYSIQRRMKEVAIRKTLGAETKTLLKELSRQYILFCVIGFVIALFPVYFLLDKWLENFAYRIDISILPFVIGFIILLLLTLIVVLSRAYQATRMNILKYLKYE